jgi:hypothetical protein
MRSLPLLALLVISLSGTAEASAAWRTQSVNAPAQASPPGQTVETPETSRIPATAIRALGLETSVAWRGVHDDQTRGHSNGLTHYPIFPDGQSGLPGRQFVTWYGDKGGQRYHLTFGRDANATHFVYEANVYLVDPTEIDQVEMDMNQVMSDGRTVIFGAQCAANSKSWEYTYVNKSGTHWHPSNIHCNPHDWGTKKWHRIQIASHRDDAGNVTFDWINFDGAYADFEGATAFSAESLRWTPGELLLNFQIDGSRKKGVMDAYLNNLAVYRW